MTKLRSIALSLIVIGALATGAAGVASHAYAQSSTTTSQPATSGQPTTSGQAASSSKADDASTWTRKKWREMKAKWSQEKEKWADCRAKSKDQKLRGRKYWSFMSSCMNA